MNKQYVKFGAIAIGVLIVMLFGFNAFIYNEANHKTYVRTFWGEEILYDTPGYHLSWWGRTSVFTDSLTIQTSLDAEALDADTYDGKVVIQAVDVQFLNNTGKGSVESSTRFQFPTGEQFLKLAREYRTQENFVNTMLLPAIKSTLNNTATLYTADEYYGGAKGLFQIEFENQLVNGLYIVQRQEVHSKRADLRPNQSANVALGTDQGEFGEVSTTSYKAQKLVDDKGMPQRKTLHYVNYGISLTEAQVTNIEADGSFKARIAKIQESQGNLMIARQERQREEQARLNAIAEGQKETEITRQLALKEQAQRTTAAETAKQVAITQAEQAKQQAELSKETAAINLERARLDAQAKKVTADADAYAKKAVIEADGALAQKLATLEAINTAWAEAYAKAPVPTISQGNTGGDGRASSSQQFMDLLTAKTAKDLAVDIKMK